MASKLYRVSDGMFLGEVVFSDFAVEAAAVFVARYDTPVYVIHGDADASQPIRIVAMKRVCKMEPVVSHMTNAQSKVIRERLGNEN